ncbi:MAG: hypothetical protein A2152_02815 [Candidatus Levybacteria bacterium RBG_16_35_6]|nr:MAG: hypothetical protein A2152_02815 [Candidatus Levybacteria bacterium RBG_16_35_6]
MSQEQDQGRKVGFIEELRERHDNQVIQAPQVKSALREEASKQREATRLSNTRWEEEKKARLEQAREYFNESGIYGLVQQVAKLDVSHEYLMGVSKPTFYSLRGLEFEFRWLVKKASFTQLEEGEIATITVCYDGRLIFDAEKEGSSELSLTEWREDHDLLESALKKAYEHPKSTRRLNGIRPHKRNPFYIPK